MDINNISNSFRVYLNKAFQRATVNNNIEVSEHHLLLAILEDENSLLYSTLKTKKVETSLIIDKLLSDFDKLAKYSNDKLENEVRLSSSLNKILIKASSISSKIMEKDFLITALSYKKSASFKLLSEFNIGISDLKSDEGDEDFLKPILRFGRELVQEVKLNKIDKVIGRDQEIRRVIRILSRKTKNNPVLIGEPGVGKTAIAEGLAWRIVRGDVPGNLLNKKIFMLDMGSLVAGAKFQGEFEERLKQVLDIIKKHNKNIILFIDELHLIVGAGKNSGAMDAGNLLKPMLARGELNCIGATTFDEYRQYIEKDKALERRFQVVKIAEPSIEDTLLILRGIKDLYEIHHGVKINDSALVAAAKLSKRYITDRFLPDKAIDLIDEACSGVRLEIDSMPADLDLLSRKIMNLEIELKAISSLDKENKENKEIYSLKSEIEKLKKDFKLQNDIWIKSRESLNKVKKLKEKIKEVNLLIEKAEREYDLSQAAELKHGVLPKLEKELIDSEDLKLSKDSVSELVTEDSIKQIISNWTNIPVQRLDQTKKDKLLNLEKELNSKVIGQESAIKSISKAILRTRSGIGNPNKPIGSFIFAGTTGVGKTELAKVLNNYLFNTKDSLIRIDMSEYMEKHSVSKLIGAPPGYVGFDQGGALTEKVRLNPYSVILFDEIEKAHPDVVNILLQVLDDGILTDSSGKLIDFKNTVIILTTNLGANYLKDDSSLEDKKKCLTKIKESFKPEFINRLDEIIIFNRLSLKDIKNIIKLEIEKLITRLGNLDLNLVFTEDVVPFIANQSFNSEYGAREVKRYIQLNIEDLIALEIVENDSTDILISVKDNILVVASNKV